VGLLGCAFAHLSLFFALRGSEIDDYMKEAGLWPDWAMEDVSWDRQGVQAILARTPMVAQRPTFSARDFGAPWLPLGVHDGLWRDIADLPADRGFQRATQVSVKVEPQLWVYLLGQYRRRALAYVPTAMPSPHFRGYVPSLLPRSLACLVVVRVGDAPPHGERSRCSAQSGGCSHPRVVKTGLTLGALKYFNDGEGTSDRMAGG